MLTRYVTVKVSGPVRAPISHKVEGNDFTAKQPAGYWLPIVDREVVAMHKHDRRPRARGPAVPDAGSEHHCDLVVLGDRNRFLNREGDGQPEERQERRAPNDHQGKDHERRGAPRPDFEPGQSD